ncbi:MAG: PD-(D/E)XK nuclease family protein [Candidatus Poseidoniaceae archaeon]
MPFGTPPSGGPLSRTRTRLSASSLTKYLRCPKQFFLGNKLGLSSPKSIYQVLGIVLEDSICSILMRRPVSINSLEGLRDWCYNLADEEAKHCFQLGKENWDSTIWQNNEQSWEDVEVEELARKIKNGLSLFLEEVEKCYNSNGGPYLEQYRKGESPFKISSPAWGEEPVFPIADKVRNFGMRSWSKDEAIIWQKSEQPVAWDEAWEIARPWIKDPRVHQPQRLFHPGGWAAGELDLVLRWDGHIRLIDIKSGNPSSKFAESLMHQLNFYAWLWHETHENQIVDGIEGWYLDNPVRIQYDVPSDLEMTKLGQKYKKIHREMLDLGEGPVNFPDDYPEPCKKSAGCFWCSFGEKDSEQESDFLTNLEQIEVKISPPSQKIGEIQSRINVKGKFTGQWGPLPNHYSEPVLGAMVSVSGTQITVEESEPNSFPKLHDYSDGEVMIINALPGVWRGNSRLYLDHKSEIISLKDDNKESINNLELTRIGLMRTRANVEGVVISIAKRDGVRLDEKPWSMVNLHIWDGAHVAEVVAFGSSITNQITDLSPLDRIKIVSAELGWRIQFTTTSNRPKVN